MNWGLRETGGVKVQRAALRIVAPLRRRGQASLSGNYDAAKRDFAVRSGLIPKQQFFREEQFIEIYRCCTDTLRGDVELSYDQEKMIQEIRKQIEECLPDIMERIQQ